MAIILSIETSTPVCSAALHDSGKLVAVMEVHQEYSHASKLGIFITELMKASEITKGNINAVAVSSGPGSYTGLRIGTSLAKGLCYALDVPLVAVPTLTLLASAVGNMNVADNFLCPMLDARRMEVYCQVFNSDLAACEPVKPEVINESSFGKYLKVKPVVFFGNGALKCREVITHENARFLSDINPSARQLGELAFRKLKQGDVENLFDFVPHYLKEFFFKKKVEALNEIK